MHPLMLLICDGCDDITCLKHDCFGGGEKAIMQEFAFTCGDSLVHGYKRMEMEKRCCDDCKSELC